MLNFLQASYYAPYSTGNLAATMSLKVHYLGSPYTPKLMMFKPTLIWRWYKPPQKSWNPILCGHPLKQYTGNMMRAVFAVARMNCHDLDTYVCISMKERTAALCNNLQMKTIHSIQFLATKHVLQH